jgi:hypothetical protein
MRRSSFSQRQGSFLTQDLWEVDFPKQDPKENPFGYSLPNNKKSCFLPKIITLGSPNELNQKTPRQLSRISPMRSLKALNLLIGKIPQSWISIIILGIENTMTTVVLGPVQMSQKTWVKSAVKIVMVSFGVDRLSPI